MKTFALALFAATSAALKFGDTAVDNGLYDTIHMKETVSKKGYMMTANYGVVKLQSANKDAYVVAMALQVGGPDIPDKSKVTSWVNIYDPKNPGVEEAWSCTATYTKPPALAEGGLYAPANGTVGTIVNACCDDIDGAPSADKGKATWVADTTDPGVSYASSYMFLAPGEEAPETPTANSWQLCSAARVVSSGIAGIDAIPAAEGA